MFSCRVLKKLVPSQKVTELLKEGARALEQHDFDAARNVYEKIPLVDRDCKPVKGFFASIDNQRKMQNFLTKTEEKHTKNNKSM